MRCLITIRLAIIQFTQSGEDAQTVDELWALIDPGTPQFSLYAQITPALILESVPSSSQYRWDGHDMWQQCTLT